MSFWLILTEDMISSLWMNQLLGKQIGKKKEHQSNTQSKSPKFYVENPNPEKPQSRTQIHYIIREITVEEERTSKPLCIYNDMYTRIIIMTLMTAHLLIEKTRLQVVSDPWSTFGNYFWQFRIWNLFSGLLLRPLKQWERQWTKLEENPFCVF